MADDMNRNDDSSDTTSENGTASARRKFLGRGGVALAAAAAGVVAMSETAGAADGETMVVGYSSTGSGTGSETKLVNSAFKVELAGNTSKTNAIHGQTESSSPSAVGVYGEAAASSALGIGVRGRSDSGIGVLGEAVWSTQEGIGVKGRGMSIGVIGEGGSGTVKGTGVTGRSSRGAALKLDPGTLTADSQGQVAGSWAAGSFVVIGGHVHYCWKATAGSTPAQWVKLSGAPIILPSGYRAYDSRAGRAPTSVVKGKIANNTTRTNVNLTVGSGGKLPTGISAVLINLAVTETGPSGYLTAYKNGTTRPDTSSINWSGSNSNLANTTIVPVDTASRISLYCVGGAHCLVDVIGYLP